MGLYEEAGRVVKIKDHRENVNEGSHPRPRLFSGEVRKGSSQEWRKVSASEPYPARKPDTLSDIPANASLTELPAVVPDSPHRYRLSCSGLFSLIGACSPAAALPYRC